MAPLHGSEPQHDDDVISGSEPAIQHTPPPPPHIPFLLLPPLSSSTDHAAHSFTRYLGDAGFLGYVTLSDVNVTGEAG